MSAMNEREIADRKKFDMSAKAVTACIERACDLSDIERMATSIRSLVSEIRGEKEVPELPFWQLKETGKKVQ